MSPASACITGGDSENQRISTDTRTIQMEQDKKPGLSYSLTSAAFGATKGVKGETVRTRYYKTGSYFGAVPIRGPNGRLLWPDNTPTQK
jgi:hypothetical protein